MRHNSSNIDPAVKSILLREMTLRWDCEYWYSYVVQGLRNEIDGNTRKSQRTCQRHFCSAYSRLQRFRDLHAELFI